VDLGEALYREITGRSPYTEVSSVGAAIEYLLVKGGSAAAGARLAGVAASTFRGWLKGRQPKNPGGIVSTAQRAQRRDRLPKGRERRMRAPGALSGVKIVGGLTYGSTPDPDREFDIGPYMDDAQNDILDAYLAGASLDDLAEIFHDAISGAPFYENVFDPGQDPGQGHMGVEITDLDGWA